MELGEKFTYTGVLMLYVKKAKNERQFLRKIGARLP